MESESGNDNMPLDVNSFKNFPNNIITSSKHPAVQHFSFVAQLSCPVSHV